MPRCLVLETNILEQTYMTSVVAPHPTTPLLTMIRLTEDVMLEVQKRGCQPLETYIFTARLKMWPVWQKGMADHVEGVKKLAEGRNMAFLSSRVSADLPTAGTSPGALGSMFRKAALTDNAVKSVSCLLPMLSSLLSELYSFQICHRYVIMFNSFVALSSQQEETMIFSK